MNGHRLAYIHATECSSLLKRHERERERDGAIGDRQGQHKCLLLTERSHSGKVAYLRVPTAYALQEKANHERGNDQCFSRGLWQNWGVGADRWVEHRGFLRQWNYSVWYIPGEVLLSEPIECATPGVRALTSSLGSGDCDVSMEVHQSWPTQRMVIGRREVEALGVRVFGGWDGGAATAEQGASGTCPYSAQFYYELPTS